MGLSRNVQCVQVSEDDDDGSLVVTGRTRLFGVCPGGTFRGYRGIKNIKLRDGSATGDVKLIIASSNGGSTPTAYFNSAPFVDLPADGILFSSGIWFEVEDVTVESQVPTQSLFSASLIVQGGGDTSA